MENGPFEDVFPMKMLIFHGHVSLLEGIYFEYFFLDFKVVYPPIWSSIHYVTMDYCLHHLTAGRAWSTLLVLRGWNGKTGGTLQLLRKTMEGAYHCFTFQASSSSQHSFFQHPVFRLVAELVWLRRTKASHHIAASMGLSGSGPISPVSWGRYARAIRYWLLHRSTWSLQKT